MRLFVCPPSREREGERGQGLGCANYLQLKFMRLPKSTKLNRLIKKPRAHTKETTISAAALTTTARDYNNNNSSSGRGRGRDIA